MKIIKNKKIILRFLVIIFLIVSVIGVKYYMDKPSTYEKQVAFLKEHEQEMTEYIKSQNAKIETVEYDWNSVEIGIIGNGTPQGGGIVLSINGKFNNIKDSNLTLAFSLKNEKSVPTMEAVYLPDSLRILTNEGWKIYE